MPGVHKTDEIYTDREILLLLWLHQVKKVGEVSTATGKTFLMVVYAEEYLESSKASSHCQPLKKYSHLENKYYQELKNRTGLDSNHNI